MVQCVYTVYGLNRLDLRSIIRLRRASFCMHIMLSASPLLCNIFWCFLIYSQANDDVLSVFRLYSDVVADIRYDFIVNAYVVDFFSYFFYLYYIVCYSAHGRIKLLNTLSIQLLLEELKSVHSKCNVFAFSSIPAEYLLKI